MKMIKPALATEADARQALREFFEAPRQSPIKPIAPPSPYRRPYRPRSLLVKTYTFYWKH